MAKKKVKAIVRVAKKDETPPPSPSTPEKSSSEKLAEFKSLLAKFDEEVNRLRKEGKTERPIYEIMQRNQAQLIRQIQEIIKKGEKDGGD